MINFSQSKNEDMIVLISWINGNMEINPEAQTMLGNFLMGQIYMITFEGFASKRYEVSQSISKSSIRANSFDNCLLIRPNPVYDNRTQLIASNEQAKEDLHLLATILSNIVIAAYGSGEQIGYLGCISNRVSANSLQSKQTNSSSPKSMKTASLVCIEAVQNSTEYLTESTDKLINRLSIEKIQNNVFRTHPVVKGFQCGEKSLAMPTPEFAEKIMQEIEIASISQKSNNEIMYGKVYVKFLENLISQSNSKNGIVDIDKAEDDIIIDQGYEAYMAGVEEFHNKSLSMIDRNQRPDDHQLQEMLDVAKGKALEVFYAKGGSSNLVYRHMLEDYVSHKDKEVVDSYSSEQWNKNLQILEVESKQVLDRIAQSHVKDQNVIMSYVNDMTKNYESQAKGPQKYEILNDYMKVFTPIAFETDPEKQALLRKEQKKNQDLLKRLAELKKKKGGCCSSCTIM